MTPTLWQQLAEAVAAMPEPFSRQEVLSWFARHYPQVNASSISTHLQGATSNVSDRGQFAHREPLVTRIDRGTYVRFVPTGDVVEFTASPVSSSVQRQAEAVMLQVLSGQLGIRLSPRRVEHHLGARVELDGATDDLSVLVECWAHQGEAKVAQKWKLVNDATKLGSLAGWLSPRPQRLVLCVSDERAVKHLRGRSWQGQAIVDLGVEIVVVDLPGDVTDGIAEAQQRQFR